LIPAQAAHRHLALTLPELMSWGEAVGRAAQPPLVIAISGPLGAGKTVLAQAICRGYGVIEPVTSPTYALVHEYAAPRSVVFHVDLYRIAGPGDLAALAWDELLSARALVLVEWPERAGGHLAADHLPIDLEYLPDDPSRRLLLAG
jgi:tRNA threonylcarbamoyladenosine biosynthesis protein TsaE